MADPESEQLIPYPLELLSNVEISVKILQDAEIRSIYLTCTSRSMGGEITLIPLSFSFFQGFNRLWKINLLHCRLLHG